METEHINRRTLAGSGHSGDADAARPPRMRQTLLDHLLRYGLMIGAQALNQCHRAAQHCHIALENTFDKLRCSRQRLALGTFVEIGVDRRRLSHSAVDRQSGILFIVFRMIHICMFLCEDSTIFSQHIAFNIFCVARFDF